MIDLHESFQDLTAHPGGIGEPLKRRDIIDA